MCTPNFIPEKPIVDFEKSLPSPFLNYNKNAISPLEAIAMKLLEYFLKQTVAEMSIVSGFSIRTFATRRESYPSRTSAQATQIRC
jgi:hypothetical protein